LDGILYVGYVALGYFAVTVSVVVFTVYKASTGRFDSSSDK